MRAFTGEDPSNEMLEAVIEAGRQAPFAGLVNREVPDFRRFFVVRAGSETAKKLAEFVVRFRAEELARAQKEDWTTKHPLYAEALERLQGQAADLFPTPTLVVVAERAGRPIREETTLGTVLENMFLKATAMNLAFCIRSVVRDIPEKDGMKALFGLPAEEDFAFDACNIGFAKGEGSRETPRPNPEKSIVYMD